MIKSFYTEKPNFNVKENHVKEMWEMAQIIEESKSQVKISIIIRVDAKTAPFLE